MHEGGNINDDDGDEGVFHGVEGWFGAFPQFIWIGDSGCFRLCMVCWGGCNNFVVVSSERKRVNSKIDEEVVVYKI